MAPREVADLSLVCARVYLRVINPQVFLGQAGPRAIQDPREERIDGCNPELAENGYRERDGGFASAD